VFPGSVCIRIVLTNTCTSLSRPEVHLPELNAVLDEYPPTVEHIGRTLINFKRYVEFSSSLRKLLQHKSPPDNPEATFYIEEQLYFTHGTEDFIVERSRALKAEEEHLDRQRLPQFRKAGFQI
jgi:hypothetical protein